MTINFEWAKQTRFQPFILLRRSCSCWYLYPQFKIWFISFISIHVIPTSCILRTYNGFSPVGLICLIDRVSRPAIANVRLGLPVKPKFFKVFFQLQFWRCYIYRLLFQPLRFVHSTTKIMFTFFFFIRTSKYDSFHLCQFKFPEAW